MSIESHELAALEFDSDEGTTPGGAKVFMDGNMKVFVPESLIEDIEEGLTTITVWVPQWWAEQEGLV